MARQILKFESESEWFAVASGGHLKCSCGRPLIKISKGRYRCSYGCPQYDIDEGDIVSDKFGNTHFRTKSHGKVKETT